MENNGEKELSRGASGGDFASGGVCRRILSLAVPMTVAQLVQLLYNIVDRIYIGHLPGASYLAFTGLGLTFPVITIVSAFTNLFGMGGAPLCSIARGKGDDQRAERIMGNTLFMLLVSCGVIMLLAYLLMRPMLYLFGASDDTYAYASEYLKIYLIGTPFAMIGTGMNGFINTQGFARTGMATIMLGAVVNIALDPLFIFAFDMGVAGAAVATVISQLASAVWVMSFLMGRRTILRLSRKSMRPDGSVIRSVASLGTAGFIMSATNGAVQIACNSTLRSYGGDMYVGIMTALNSIRDIVSLPIQGLTNASQPVIGYNFGAREYGRVKRGIAFSSLTGVVYMLLAWLILFLFPAPIISIFNSDPALIEAGVPFMHMYFFGFFMMAFQFSGQSAFVGLGQSRQAVFFSLFRKIIIVVPLTILLPRIAALGVSGVFIAEPISNFVGGLASFVTMLFTVRRLIRNGERDALRIPDGK